MDKKWVGRVLAKKIYQNSWIVRTKSPFNSGKYPNINFHKSGCLMIFPNTPMHLAYKLDLECELLLPPTRSTEPGSRWTEPGSRESLHMFIQHPVYWFVAWSSCDLLAIQDPIQGWIWHKGRNTSTRADSLRQFLRTPQDSMLLSGVWDAVVKDILSKHTCVGASKN